MEGGGVVVQANLQFWERKTLSHSFIHYFGLKGIVSQGRRCIMSAVRSSVCQYCVSNVKFEDLSQRHPNWTLPFIFTITPTTKSNITFRCRTRWEVRRMNGWIASWLAWLKAHPAKVTIFSGPVEALTWNVLYSWWCASKGGSLNRWQISYLFIVGQYTIRPY